MEKTQGQLWDLGAGEGRNREGQPHSAVCCQDWAALAPRREGLPFSSHLEPLLRATLPLPSSYKEVGQAFGQEKQPE